MLPVPRFIISIYYFVPLRLPVTADIGGAAFRSLPVQSQVAADEFDLNNACRVLQSRLPLSNSARKYRVYAICDHEAAEFQVLSRQRVANGVAHCSGRKACRLQGLFDCVDPDVRHLRFCTQARSPQL
jgi:hypothetical protein